MAIFNITFSLGQGVGYMIGTFNSSEQWCNSFWILGILICYFGFVIIISPSKYFLLNVEVARQRNGKKKKIASDNLLISKEKLFNMIAILKKKLYFFSIFSRVSFLLIFHVIHVCINDYSKSAFGIENTKTISYYYGIPATFAPPLGGILGGFISSKAASPNKKESIWIIIIFGLISLIASFPLVWTTNFILFGCSLFVFFFCVSACLPTLVAYVFSAVPIEHKPLGPTLNMIIITFLGNFPGPIMYGLIKKYKSNDQTFAWKCIILYSIVGYISILFTSFFKYKALPQKIQKTK
jgi:MFS family permease